MKKYNFAPTTTNDKDNVVILNGHQFMVSDEVSDAIADLLKTALEQNHTAIYCGENVQPQTSKKSEKKAAKPAPKKSVTKTAKTAAENGERRFVATIVPNGNDGIEIQGVGKLTWKAIFAKCKDRYGSVKYDPARKAVVFSSKELRDKALADDELPVVVWKERKA